MGWLKERKGKESNGEPLDSRFNMLTRGFPIDLRITG